MFIAITRFSLYQPKSSAWITSRAVQDECSLKKYKEGLFDEKRLDFRIGFLSNVTLPLLDKSSKNIKFVHIVEYSSILQLKYIKQLKELQNKYHFLVLNEYDEFGESRSTSHQLAIKHLQLCDLNKDCIIGQFMLDDDDCISKDFLEKSSKYLNKSFFGHIISHGLGVYGVFDDENKVVNITESYYPKVNIGLLRIGAYRHAKNAIVLPKLGTHTKADRYSPTLIDSREVSYWWSKHNTQDTANLKVYTSDYNKIKEASQIDTSIISEKFGDDFIDNLNSI